MPERAGRIRRMHKDTAEILRGEHFIEEGKLAICRPSIGVGGGEMGVDADELWPEDLANLRCLVRFYAPAVHAGVDLEVCLQTGTLRYTLRARDRVCRDLQAILSG